MGNTVSFAKFGKSFQEDLVRLIISDRPFADQIFEVLDLNPKVILVEKPLTYSEKDYERIIKISSKKNICVNYLRNWDPRIKEFAKKINSYDQKGILLKQQLPVLHLQ